MTKTQKIGAKVTFGLAALLAAAVIATPYYEDEMDNRAIAQAEGECLSAGRWNPNSPAIIRAELHYFNSTHDWSRAEAREMLISYESR